MAQPAAAHEHVTVSQADGILEIRIQRPERKNALTHGMYDAITRALVTADTDPAVRVALITGTDDCFTAGNDMVEFLKDPPKGDDSPVMRFLAQLLAQEKPLVAAVNGPAVGVGTTLLLHCDLVYCARSAKLQMPFVSLGLCPEAGASMLLPMIMGHPRAAELLMLSETFSGEEAVALGIANAVYEDGEYLAEARRQAARLAAQPPASVRLTKAFLRGPTRDAVAAHMKLEGDTFLERLSSPEAREAMTAFMEKRKPDFSRFS
ncbi:enoyl-CoA hydratase [Alcanivorax sp. JB21]|uniref:enoyl-CoA hydratase n=1 Tax=Alcanivorax limicola TaxID=2874102 RepID=UPI001CBD84FA|nr:enoyl-CoA hydratase [Alcanivorax limicola]MBZ2189173.1 enoyl-CoA hydratase [Alcanivorax limicola]